MNHSYQAIILAAGRGNRIAEETWRTPKALLPIGPRALDNTEKTSFLRRQVELLAALGVMDVVVVVGWLGGLVMDELEKWAPHVKVVRNTTPDIAISGSLHSLQFAARAGLGLLDGSKSTLYMDADIVYHRAVLELFLSSDQDRSSMLVCSRHDNSLEEVLVYGSSTRPRFLGKGLTPPLVDGEPCLGEAAGIVKLAPADHALALTAIDWMLGDPDAPQNDLRRAGFGPARRATEHEELTARLMRHGRMVCRIFGPEFAFMEVDSPEEYRKLRTEVYPEILRLEASEAGAAVP